MTTDVYRQATDEEFENSNCDECYDLLVGPRGFSCLLTEPEDRRWCRDLRPVVAELNRLSAIPTVDSSFAEAVEQRVGWAAGAWDMVSPIELCEAVLAVAAERKAGQ